MAEERNYYCICDDNCKFPTMTEEQILEAIAEATGNTPTSVDDAFISKLKEMNFGGNFTVWVGTTAEYNALESIEQNRFYILTDETWGDDVEAFVMELNAKVDSLTNETQWMTIKRQAQGFVQTIGYYKIKGNMVYCNLNYCNTDFYPQYQGTTDNFELPFLLDIPTAQSSSTFSKCESTFAIDEHNLDNGTHYNRFLHIGNGHNGRATLYGLLSGSTVTYLKGSICGLYAGENPAYQFEK